MNVRGVGRLAVGAVVLVAVVATLDPSRTLQELAAADLRLAIPAVLGLAAVHAVAAAGWRWMVAERGGPRLPWNVALRAHYAAQAVGSVTPGNLGSDVHRAGALRRAGHPWSVAIEPIMAQRVTSYVALSLLAGMGVVVISSVSDLGRTVVLLGGLVALILAIAAWIILRRRGSPPWRTLLVGLSTGLAFHAAAIALTLVLVVAIDPAAPVLPMLAALAVARLSLGIPITPSGLGIQEGALVVILATLQLQPHAAVAAMLFARLSTFAVALLGIALIVRGGTRLPQVEGTLRPTSSPARRSPARAASMPRGDVS